ERWLPALGLGDRCARLLGTAADRRGDSVWHVYEDLGDDTLATNPSPECVQATVDLMAELHTRAARHPVLPDVRRYAATLGVEYFRRTSATPSRRSKRSRLPGSNRPRSTQGSPLACSSDCTGSGRTRLGARACS